MPLTRSLSLPLTLELSVDVPLSLDACLRTPCPFLGAWSLHNQHSSDSLRISTVVDLDGGDSVRSRFSKDYDMYRGVLVYAICSCKE